jgi:beta-glucosidase
MRSYLRLVPVVVAGGFAGLVQQSCKHDIPDDAYLADDGTGNTGNGTAGSSTNPTGGSGPVGPDGTGIPPVVTPRPEDEVLADGTSPAVTKAACASNPGYTDKYSTGYWEKQDPAVKDIVGRMTTGQKIQQMQGVPVQNFKTQYTDIQRSVDVQLDASTTIRGYMYRDGPHGLNLDALQEDRKSETSYSTVFPVTALRAAMFDPEMEYQIGAAMGDETAASRNTMLLVPCMNILRNPLWGRSQETYSEDTYLTGRMASAMTLGVQQYVVGCAKHWAANNIESGRMTQDSVMDEQTLRETYGRHFRMVVQDGGNGCVMASYNKVNGTKATQNRHLLTDVLRTDFKFRGLVLSDWWAMPPAGQTIVTDGPTAQRNAAEAANAGLDIEVPWINNYAQLAAVVGVGKPVSEATITAAATRVLEQKFRFKSAYGKLGDATSGTTLSLKAPSTRLEAGQIAGNEAHLDIARQAAVKGMVLLKNESNTLPIPSGKKVAVVGMKIAYSLQSTKPRNGVFDFARDIGLGDRGSSRVNADPAKTKGALVGITEAGAEFGATVTASETIDEAVNGADFIVVMVGNTPDVEGEEYAIKSGGDRKSLSLPAGEDDLVAQVAALGKPMAVVIQAGSVVAMPWLDQVPSVVMAWYPGQYGGLALGQLLFGKENFSGRLPITWANNLEELDVFHDPSNATKMDYFIGYRHYDQKGITPLRPFGYGLSYTTFEYKALQTPCSSVKKDGVIDVKVDIKNTGTVAGEEVPMIFVSFPETGARRSKKELKGFARVLLQPGETKRVTIPVRVKDLDYYDMTKNAWVIESGSYTFKAGPNAGDLPLTDTVVVE